MANKVPFYYDPEEFKNWVYYSERCGELELEVLRLTSMVEVLTMERDKLLVDKEDLLLLRESRNDEIENGRLMLIEDVRVALSTEYESMISEKVQLKMRISELEEEVALLEEDNSFLQHESEKERGGPSTDSEKLEELQRVIGDLTSNWRLAIDHEKQLAGEIASLRLERDSLNARLKALQGDKSQAQ